MTERGKYEEYQYTRAFGVLWIGRGSPIWASPWRVGFLRPRDAHDPMGGLLPPHS